jgi:hypothetical protein
MLFGPFVVDPATPTVILLNGEIDIRSALEFRKALKAAPTASILVLNSPGGSVQIGLLIADDVFEKGISTYIPPGGFCASACAYVFLAGRSRTAAGRLGVHQISSEVQDNASIQLNLSDVIEALNKYGTSPEVMTLMLKTPSDQIHYFSDEEIAPFGLNRIDRPPEIQSSETQPPAGAPPKPKLRPFSIDNFLKSIQSK